MLYFLFQIYLIILLYVCIANALRVVQIITFGTFGTTIRGQGFACTTGNTRTIYPDYCDCIHSQENECKQQNIIIMHACNERVRCVSKEIEGPYTLACRKWAELNIWQYR